MLYRGHEYCRNKEMLRIGGLQEEDAEKRARVLQTEDVEKKAGELFNERMLDRGQEFF